MIRVAGGSTCGGIRSRRAMSPAGFSDITFAIRLRATVHGTLARYEPYISLGGMQ